MVEWLKRFDYGAELPKGHDFEVGLRSPTTGKLCQPSSERVLFSNQDRIRRRKERDGLCLSSAVPKIQWFSNPYCLYGY